MPSSRSINVSSSHSIICLFFSLFIHFPLKPLHPLLQDHPRFSSISQAFRLSTHISLRTSFHSSALLEIPFRVDSLPRLISPRTVASSIIIHRVAPEAVSTSASSSLKSPKWIEMERQN